MARQRSGGSATLGEVVGGDGKATEDTPAPGAAVEPPAAPASHPLPSLPTERTVAGADLASKTVLLYGEPKIGKSTLASEWAGGDVMFFDCAGELADLEVYRMGCTDWTNFRENAASYVKHMTSSKPKFTGCVIDTADVWAQMCAQDIRKRLGVAHESDADWGKGWTLVREELQSKLARLQVSPGGVILVSHSKDVEIKAKRGREAYTRYVPTLAGGVREVVVNAADLVLFIDWSDDGENRVIYTKPDPSFDAGERGKTPRLPKAIPWPTGVSGWQVLKEAWDAGSSS